MVKNNKRLVAILLVATVLLIIPGIAMQFTDEVTWSLFDFLVAAVLLFGAGLLCEWILRKITGTRKRLLLCASVLAVLILIWLELAVGIVGTAPGGH